MNKRSYKYPCGDIEIIEFIFKSNVNYKPAIDEEVIFNNCTYIVIAIREYTYQTQVMFANKEEWYQAHKPYGG